LTSVSSEASAESASTTSSAATTTTSGDGLGICTRDTWAGTARRGTDSIILIQDDEYLAKLAKVKTSPDLVVYTGPLLLCEIWDEPKASVHELEGHGALIQRSWRDQGQLGTALMGDEPVLGPVVLPDVGLPE